MSGWSRAVPYIGVAQGAFSLCAGAYWENHHVLRKWEDDVAAGTIPTEQMRVLDERAAYATRAMRVLRTAQAIDAEGLEDEIGAFGVAEELRDWLDRQAAYGLLEPDGTTYRLTIAGQSLIHWMLAELADVLAPSLAAVEA